MYGNLHGIEAGTEGHRMPVQLPTPETHGETGSVHPKRSQKATLKC